MVTSSTKPVIALYCTRSALEYLAKSKWTSNDTQDKRSPPSAAHLILVIYLILLLFSMFQEDCMHPYLKSEQAIFKRRRLLPFSNEADTSPFRRWRGRSKRAAAADASRRKASEAAGRERSTRRWPPMQAAHCSTRALSLSLTNCAPCVPDQEKDFSIRWSIR